MVTVSEYVEVDVELDEFDEEDIVEYLQELGYIVIEADAQTIDHGTMRDINHAIWEYKNGSVKEAVKLIEICFPDFKGLSEKVV